MKHKQQPPYAQYVIKQFRKSWPELVVKCVLKAGGKVTGFECITWQSADGNICTASWSRQEGRFVSVGFRVPETDKVYDIPIEQF